MMKRNLLSASLILSTLSVFSQKLPDVQSTGLAAPTGVKIDGKSTEWNDTFSAENKRTEILYTVANDDKNLYLVVKSANSNAANKIMMGGLSFTVNTQGKKRDKEAYTVTYPLIPRGNRNQGGRGGQGGGQFRMGQGGMQNRPQQTPQQRDSAMAVQRKAQLATVKEIKIAGFKSIPDSLVSIYNEYGLKAVGSFDQKGSYVYELAIPLSLLDLTNGSELAYQIKLNGMSGLNFGGGGNFGGGQGRGPQGPPAPGGNRGFGGGGGQDMMMATDFWGKYILIKK